MKNFAKTESYSEFLARGGKITKCPTKDLAKKFTRKVAKEKEEQLEQDVDWSVLPQALKISYGVKD